MTADQARWRYYTYLVATRYGDAVWSPLGPDGPTSELQEALEAAYGTGRPDGDGDPIVLISPHQRWRRELAARARPASRRAVGWAWGLATAALAVVIGSLVYSWLAGH
jgi:hypothetical protein